MKITLGADHGAFHLREATLNYLKENGHEVIDHGTYSTDSVDYPDFVDLVCRDLREEKAELGILCCTTGLGMSIAANKQPGIRAALVHYNDEAGLSRRHNNANVLCMGQLHTTAHEAAQLIDTFLSAPFEEGRHARRVAKFTAWENQNPTV